MPETLEPATKSTATPARATTSRRPESRRTHSFHRDRTAGVLHHRSRRPPVLPKTVVRRDGAPSTEFAARRRSSAASATTHPRRKSAIARFFGERFGIEKVFTVLTFVVAVTVSVLSALDLATAWPWNHASRLFDSVFLISGLTLLALTFDVFKDQSRMRSRSRGWVYASNVQYEGEES